MALFIPKVVQSLFVQMADASRVRDNIVTALQPVLDFFNTYLLINADGSLTFRNINTGTINSGSQTISGTETILPQVSGDVFVIMSVDGKMQMVRIMDNGSTLIEGILIVRNNITSTKIITGNSVVSQQGFCDTVSVGTYWNSAYTANNLVPLNFAVSNSGGLGGLGVTPYMRKVTRACSIVGYSLSQVGPNTGVNNLMFYKNGALLFQWAAGAGNNNNATFWGTQPKGTYPLAAGDTFSVSYASSAAGNTQVQAYVTFEMSA